MILSALATSVGLNLALTVLLAGAYSLLRRRPPYVEVYSPRRPHAPLEPWLPAAWRRSEEDIHVAAGLDGVVFVRIFVFSIRVFAAAAVLGVGVLLPVNFLGDQLREIDFSDLPNKSIDLFSVSNVQDGSNKLWLHFSAVYIITGIACYLLYHEYKYISGKRLEYFMTSMPLPQHFTVLVRAIPVSDGVSVGDAVGKFFKEYHSSTYLSHTVVHQTGKLRRLLNDAENIYAKLTDLKYVRRSFGDPPRKFLGLFGGNDLHGKYQKRLEELEENVRMEQSDATRRQEIPAAFVSFKSRYGAANAVYIRQSDNPTEWQTEHAPDPHDVYWPFFSTSFMERWISKFVVFVASILLILVFLLVVAFVQGLTYLEQLEKWLPFLRNILEIAVVSQLVTGYLPSVILHFLSSYVPSIMKLFSTMQGFVSISGIERSACSKMLRFTIWTVFFANVLTGSVLGQLEIFLNPKEIPSRLAVVVPAQASFFIAYVVTSWTSITSELTQTTALFCHLWGKCAKCCKRDDSKAPSMTYHSEIPRILLFGLLGLTYFIVAPLILPFVLVYFCLGYFIFRNQLFNVYSPKYDTGGRFWPVVHNTTIFSLVVLHIITIGVFGLKKLPLASSLLVPLPILTLLFNEFCRNRFLPIFRAYSTESLIKKDREEQSKPEMAEFFSNLVTVYCDPALKPIQRSSNSDERTAPLLSSA
ncbi:CSC1-like protein HYP1 [Phragmites australis]|uniref:CSC1-like protein HYP1 n=1 Tax=Phragmites australis TaxID=29695 RepID=UPI002D778DAC|nr:CSC1-like protein HYP1 [Phragmites australis]